jgi:hypothetical protein
MDASIFATALKEDVVAISRPSLGESSLNDCAAMSQPAKLRVGYHIFKKPMSTSAAQKVRRGNKHAGRCDPRTRLRNKDGDPFVH